MSLSGKTKAAPSPAPPTTLGVREDVEQPALAHGAGGVDSGYQLGS